MSEQASKLFGINSDDELRTKIATEIKSMNLADVFDSESTNKVLADMVNRKSKSNMQVELEKAKSSIPSSISEAQTVNSPETTKVAADNATVYTEPSESRYEMNDFPGNMKPAETLQPSGPMTGGTNYTNIAGNTNIDQSTNGNIPAYRPKLPEFMDKIGAAQIVIFNMNEVSEGGERLSLKPFRTMEDPDVKKSMNDFWLESGKRRADVYLAKFEKIGEIDFDYSDGNSAFHEHRVEIDTNPVNNYQENPYKAKSTPEAIERDQAALETYIKSSVDIQKVVSDMVSNILQNHFNTNQASKPAVTDAIPQPVVQESKIIDKFDVKIVDVANNFIKTDLPQSLQESISKNDNKFLKNQNAEVQEFVFEGRSYYMPVDKLSTRKGYIKPEIKSRVL